MQSKVKLRFMQDTRLVSCTPLWTCFYTGRILTATTQTHWADGSSQPFWNQLGGFYVSAPYRLIRFALVDPSQSEV